MKKSQFNFVKASENPQLAFVKILLYGDTGAGKTTYSVSTKSPLVLLTELNGSTAIQHKNQNATFVHITDANQLAGLLRLICSNPKDFSEYDCIVIDSLTEMQRLVKDRITGGSGRPLKLQEWGKLAADTLSLIRRIRDLPFNVCCTALMETSIVEDTGDRFVKPEFEGRKTSNQISQYFNLVGCLYREFDGELTHRKVIFESGSKIMCKPLGPIKGTIDITNFSLGDIIKSVQAFGGKNAKA
jgi:phage nucleotide-binding protein